MSQTILAMFNWQILSGWSSPLKLRPCENSLLYFCTSALLKSLKLNLLYSKKSRWSSFQKCKSLLDNSHMVLTLESTDCNPPATVSVWIFWYTLSHTFIQLIKRYILAQTCPFEIWATKELEQTFTNNR